MVMFHVGSRFSKQGWQSRSESVLRQNTAGLRLRTRQQDSFAGSNQWRKSSIHEAAGSAMNDELSRCCRSDSNTFAMEKLSQVVKCPHRCC